MTAKEALGHFRRPIVPGVNCTLSTNPGVVFGLPMPRLLVAAITLATGAMVLWFFATCDAKAHLVQVALALVLAGAVGNLYDRLFSKVSVAGFEPIRHQVRDFIDCSGFHYPWIFNVADVWLVVGVVLMVLNWWLTARQVNAGRPGRSAES